MNFAPGKNAPQRPVIDKDCFYVASALAAVFAVATITLLVVVFTTGTGSTKESHTAASAEAVSTTCGGDYYLTLGADKMSLTFEDSTTSGKGESILRCVLRETGAPSSIDSRISHTRGLDGNQNAKLGRLEHLLVLHEGRRPERDAGAGVAPPWLAHRHPARPR